MTASAHATRYLQAAAEISCALDGSEIDEIARRLAALRERSGRLFIVGVGGGAGHASHAVNDFRKLCGIETYAPSDNVSELTARINDDGWETAYSEWLKVSRLSDRDGLLVFSVGGGSRERNTSVNLVNAIELAADRGAFICGIVGSPGGALAQLADVAVIVTTPPELKTPLVEAFQAVVWHGLVCHPQLAVKAGRWETLEGTASS